MLGQIKNVSFSVVYFRLSQVKHSNDQKKTFMKQDEIEILDDCMCDICMHRSVTLLKF